MPPLRQPSTVGKRKANAPRFLMRIGESRHVLFVIPGGWGDHSEQLRARNFVYLTCHSLSLLALLTALRYRR